MQVHCWHVVNTAISAPIRARMSEQLLSLGTQLPAGDCAGVLDGVPGASWSA
jgi:hypothetical protein